MRELMTRGWHYPALTALSAALLVLSFPDFDLPYFIWIALVPMLLVIKRSTALEAFLYSLAAGFLFFSGLLSWLSKTGGVNLFNFSLSMLLLASYFGIFGLLAHFFQRKSPFWNAFALPAAWVILEYLRSHIFFLSTSWGILGYSQYSVLPVARIAAFAGVYGISFLIVLVNTVFSEAIEAYRASSRQGVFATEQLHGSWKVLVGLLLTGFLFLFGFSRPSFTQEKDIPAVKVALVQGNVYWDVKRYREDVSYREGVFQKYSDMTLKAAEHRPDLILWPSSSVPGNIPFERMRVAMLSDIAKKTDSFLLVGSSGFDKFRPDQRKTRQLSNSAFLFSPQGRLLGRYDKIRLLPFDEYLPLRGYVKWPSWIAKDMIDSLPGSDKTVFVMDRAMFAVLICWENMFPEQFREMAARGVNFMVSMTNEGFTKVSSGHHQMLAVNVLRAIENHVAIARISSTGVSCVIGPDGRIMNRVQDQGMNDVNVEGCLISSIPLTSERSFYNRYGDWFVAMLAVLLSSVYVGEWIMRSVNRYRGV
ncbi:MAG: apolipoprotein N-acyltransferase [Nitrospirae bacterium]|nr:apolipoprotein N-acyltransferase [Nitrospirota bacterium]